MPVPQNIKFVVGWASCPPKQIQFRCGTAYQILKRRIFILCH
ncbi:hypothetical protein [Microcoleus vaginatus]